MPHFRKIDIKILSGNDYVEERDVVAAGKITECRIAEKWGRFICQYKNMTDGPVAIEATFDGRAVGAIHVFPRKYSYDQGLCTGNCIKPFVFAKIGRRQSSSQIGVLKFEVFRVKNLVYGSGPLPDDDELKIGLRLGEAEEVEGEFEDFVKDSTYIDQLSDPYATFKIFYDSSKDPNKSRNLKAATSKKRPGSTRRRPNAPETGSSSSQQRLPQRNLRSRCIPQPARAERSPPDPAAAGRSASPEESAHQEAPRSKAARRRESSLEPARDTHPGRARKAIKQEHQRVPKAEIPDVDESSDDDIKLDVDERIKLYKAKLTILEHKKRKQQLTDSRKRKRKQDSKLVIDLTQDEFD